MAILINGRNSPGLTVRQRTDEKGRTFCYQRIVFIRSGTVNTGVNVIRDGELNSGSETFFFNVPTLLPPSVPSEVAMVRITRKQNKND